MHALPSMVCALCIHLTILNDSLYLQRLRPSSKVSPSLYVRETDANNRSPGRICGEGRRNPELSFLAL